MVEPFSLLEDARFGDDIMLGRNGTALNEFMAGWTGDKCCDECLATIVVFNIGESLVLPSRDGTALNEFMAGWTGDKSSDECVATTSV